MVVALPLAARGHEEAPLSLGFAKRIPLLHIDSSAQQLHFSVGSGEAAQPLIAFPAQSPAVALLEQRHVVVEHSGGTRGVPASLPSALPGMAPNLLLRKRRTVILVELPGINSVVRPEPLPAPRVLLLRLVLRHAVQERFHCCVVQEVFEYEYG